MAGIFDWIRSGREQNTASIAKERLQILVAHERDTRRKRSTDYLPALKRELLEVVRKYVAIDQDQIKVHLEREGDLEVLELNITLPDDDQSGAKDENLELNR